MPMKGKGKQNRYEQLIEAVFSAHHKPGVSEFEFERPEIERFARELNVPLPKNIGDIIYSFRYRASLPARIRESAPQNTQWVIEPAGKGRYRFKAVAAPPTFVPNDLLLETKVPDATPGIISMYALGDEQALLAKIRYNRLVDIFTGVTCYSLQNHLRTFVADLGQVETDEVYVGLDRAGTQYVFPVQAKAGSDKLNAVQVQQDFALCAGKFPALVARPVGAQFMDESKIALFEFADEGDGIRIALEKNYRLVSPDELTLADLEAYRRTRMQED